MPVIVAYVRSESVNRQGGGSMGRHAILDKGCRDRGAACAGGVGLTDVTDRRHGHI